MKGFRVKEAKKYRTSLRLPEIVLDKISISMGNNGYGLRSRSKWICEAVRDLVQQDGYWDLIAEEFMDNKENEVILVTMDEETNSSLSKAAQDYIENFQADVIDQSVILRAAIIQRLIKENGGLVR